MSLAEEDGRVVAPNCGCEWKPMADIGGLAPQFVGGGGGWSRPRTKAGLLARSRFAGGSAPSWPREEMSVGQQW